MNMRPELGRELAAGGLGERRGVAAVVCGRCVAWSRGSRRLSARHARAYVYHAAARVRGRSMCIRQCVCRVAARSSRAYEHTHIVPTAEWNALELCPGWPIILLCNGSRPREDSILCP